MRSYGSVQTQGYSMKDLDLLLTPTTMTDVWVEAYAGDDDPLFGWAASKFVLGGSIRK